MRVVVVVLLQSCVAEAHEAQPQLTNKNKQDLPNRVPPCVWLTSSDSHSHLSIGISLPHATTPALSLGISTKFSPYTKPWIQTLRVAGDLLNASETRERSRTSPKVRLPALSTLRRRLEHVHRTQPMLSRPLNSTRRVTTLRLETRVVESFCLSAMNRSALSPSPIRPPCRKRTGSHC